MFIKALLVLVPVFTAARAKAEKVFDFTATCQQAYQQISSLKITNGQLLVQQARKENPDNLIPEILDSYIDFYVLFLNEDKAEYDKRIGHFEERLGRIEEGPSNSPFYNYWRTVIYMHKACVEIKFGRQWAAGWSFRKAFSLIKENKKNYPGFQLNNMIYGPMQVAAGTIPPGYKWLASIFGIKGSIKDGMSLIQQFLNNNDPLAKLFFNEASFYYCYVLFYVQNEQEEVFRFIAQRKLDLVNNHLLAYMAANLAINNKRTEYAKNIIINRNKSSEYLDIAIWDFEMAYVKLHHLETAEAIQYFQRFFAKFRGNFYVKDAYEKMSWCYYLQGNAQAAEQARKQVLQKGSLITDADKQAQKDAKSGVWPNNLLLKVRLLNDGGYNNEALALLHGKSAADFAKAEEKLEFAYRVGRIYDDIGRDTDAIKMYALAIQLGKDRTEYYAARAALQIGWIYERQGKKELAKQYYTQCMDMEDHDYKDSLDQKAKAGIARCEGT
ncbi:tetratricopeptide repeat protein [Panacibacter sp. DH6]|uniref:Tetratricopeptide repeat protein n=1 Tax=Panacibacter microcysteis TaxID=2793269 RepID=A0A931MCT1_9BACT|nr:tetratricopeptide repeat protein [Panacibacter microcysteis]MBG9378291.1 tetratricopeptide repeat protein [Panacibacter microcysteis]